jgi:spore coat protein U-like protein
VLHLWGEGAYSAPITATATGLEYEKELLLLGDVPAGERPPVEAYLTE